MKQTLKTPTPTKQRWTNALVLMGVTALPLASPWIDEKPAAAKSDDLPAQVRQLGSADGDVRKAAFEALEKRGEAARADLEKAAKSDDPELRFNATLLLDRLDDQRAARGRALDAVGGARGWLRDSGEAPEEDAAAGGESSGGPRRSVRRSLGTPPVPFDSARLEELHQQMVRRLESLHQEFGQRFGEGFGPTLRFDFGEGGGGGGGHLQLRPGSVMSRSSDVDGVREKVTIRVEADGRAVAEVERDGKQERYEADSLEQLRADHAALFEGFGAMQMQTRSRLPQTARPRLERLDPGRELIERDAVVPAGPRLGVQVEPLHPAVAEYLELEEGVGLRVVEVVAGSAAEQLGVRRNDLILEVNGQTIRGVADVPAALGKEKGAAEDAVVTVLRKGVRLDL